MDRLFKFWEALLKQNADGKAAAAAMEALIKDGIRKSGEYLDLFSKIYEIDTRGRGTAEWKARMDKAEADFLAAFTDLFSAMGVVSQSTYQALLDEHEALKKTVAEQAETIRQLRRNLAEKTSGGTHGTQPFSEMMATQQAQFEKLMESMARLYSPEKEKSGPGDEL